MRKKQSVTQRVVLDDDATPENKGDDAAECETNKSTEDTDSTENSTVMPGNTDDTLTEAQSSKIISDIQAVMSETEIEAPVPLSKLIPKDIKQDVESVNLFDEDGNAILPDGTLIIQPTDVDGDRPSSGPAPAPSEGSSLQFDFKDGNPDPKFIMASQSVPGSNAPAPGEPGVLDVVKCTTCTTKLNPYHKDDLAVHPVLKVITCKRCMRWYNSVEWSKDEDGKDNQCRWCGEGGQLICCDVCHNTFCKTCIKRNLGRSVLQEIEDLPEDALWRCYVCDQGPLLPLQQGCAQIIEKVEAYRMGKLQRKFRLQGGKKQSENKKPVPVVPTTVTVSVTPAAPINIRPQMGMRMTNQSVVNSTLGGPRSMTPGVGMNSQTRPQFSGRMIQSGPRGPRSMLPNTGLNMMNAPGAMNVQRPMGQMQPTRYPGAQIGRPQTAVRATRPVGRPTTVSMNQNRMQSTQSANAAAAAAGSSAATEEWYEQNCSLREILREVNSVDPSNIELALKTTLKELQSWTRKCNHLENELRGALNDAQRRTVVHKFKSTFRLNLLLRLGKIHTLMQKESGLQMAVAAQRSAVMAAQAQSQGRSTHLTTPIVNPNNKKMMVTPNRSNMPNIGNRVPQAGKMSGGVIDLTEDTSAFINKTLASAPVSSLLPNPLPSSNTTPLPGVRISNVVSKVDSKPSISNVKLGPTSNTAVAAIPSTTTPATKMRQRSGSSAHVVVSSEDEEEEEDDGMIDDRSDKTWTGTVARASGTRRKSARLAAKTPSSVTEGSESSQGVEESDDSQQPKMVVRLPYVKKSKRAKLTSNEGSDRRMDVDDNEDSKEGVISASALNDNNDNAASVVGGIKDEAIEVVVDQSVLSSMNSSKTDASHEGTAVEKSNEQSDETKQNHSNGTDKDTEKSEIISNGINNTEDSNSHDKAEGNAVESKENETDNKEVTSENLPTEGAAEPHINKEPVNSIETSSSAATSNIENQSHEIPNKVNINEENKETEKEMKELSPTLESQSNLSSQLEEHVESSELVKESIFEATPQNNDSNDVEMADNGPPSPENSNKCITVSMWGPTDDGDGGDSALTGKRRASELECVDDNAKRQKLDQ